MSDGHNLLGKVSLPLLKRPTSLLEAIEAVRRDKFISATSIKTIDSLTGQLAEETTIPGVRKWLEGTDSTGVPAIALGLFWNPNAGTALLPWPKINSLLGGALYDLVCELPASDEAFIGILDAKLPLGLRIALTDYELSPAVQKKILDRSSSPNAGVGYLLAGRADIDPAVAEEISVGGSEKAKAALALNPCVDEQVRIIAGLNAAS